MKLINCLIFASLFFVMVQSAMANQNLEKQKEALRIISDFAVDFCKTPPLKSETESIELSGEAKVKLDGLLQKITDIGIEGSANYQKEKKKGVLQKDLALLLKDASKCRLIVWSDLNEKLILTPEQSNSNTFNFDTRYLKSGDENSVYEGEVKNGKPDGHGRLTVRDSSRKVLVYEGEFNRGLFHGKGVLTNYKSNSFGNNYLDGEFRYDQFISGKASINFDRYELRYSGRGANIIRGHYKGDVTGSRENYVYPYEDLSRLVLPHGKGVFKYYRDIEDGNSLFTFDGTWKDGNFTGEGIIYLPNDGYVKGEFIYGNLHSGYAKNLTHENSWGVQVPFSGRYTGEIENSMFNGNGKLTPTSITFRREFDGIFRDGEFWTGQGAAPMRSDIEEDKWPYGEYGSWKDGEFIDGTSSFIGSDGHAYRNTLSNGKVIKHEKIE